jgi:hypothetical protein
MKTLFLLAFLTISSFAAGQRSLVVTISNPGESAPGFQFSHIIRTYGYQIGGERLKGTTRAHASLCAPITDEMSWLTLGLGYSLQSKNENLTYEFGFLTHLNKLAFSVNIDGRFTYGRMGFGINF